MKPTLGGGPVYFLAEAPGRDEDENTGQPLTGPSGKLLRECIPSGHGRDCSFDNVVRDRPPGNRTPVFQEIEACRGYVTKSIEQAKPKLIIGLGAVPLHWMLGTADIAGLRGRVFAVKVGSHSCHFMPTYHPSFILRSAYDKRKPLNSRLGHCFRMDITRAFASVGNLFESRVFSKADILSGIVSFSSNVVSSYTELTSYLKIAKQAPVKCIDLETSGLRPYAADAAILTAAISFDEVNFSFALDHPKSLWTKKQRQDILDIFVELLTDETIKVAHNAPFELEWLINYFGTRVAQHGNWECTMMQAHFLDERKGGHRDTESSASRYQGLGFLTLQHFGIDIKKLFKLNKSQLAKSDLKEILTYNAVDTKFTLKLWHVQTRLLEERGLYDAYMDALPRQAAVALIQSIGVPVDLKEKERAQKQLGGEIDAALGAITTLAVVTEFEKKQAFNPLSNDDVVVIFRDYLKRPEVTFSEAGGTRYSTNKNVLDQIDHPLANLLLQLRNKSKLLSTYVDGLPVYPDGKLHTSFNTCLTETGRLSSDSPNLQNFPKRNDGWVRKLIVAPQGHLMVAIDYGQLEACTGAMCSGDKYLVKALWEDYDIHQEWALKAAHKAPGLIGGKANIADKAKMKKFRSLIKNKLVFPAFFGAANESVHDYLVAGTGYDVSQHDVDDLMDEFWATFDGFKQWQDRTMKRFYEIGYVETLVGRRHHYPLTRNQAINMPVQGTAAELVCDAMCRLSLLAAESQQWHLHPVLNVHDDISFFLPDNDAVLEDALRIFTREMLTFGYQWINVPLSVEVSIGKNWAELEPIGKFWSNRDI